MKSRTTLLLLGQTSARLIVHTARTHECVCKRPQAPQVVEGDRHPGQNVCSDAQMGVASEENVQIYTSRLHAIYPNVLTAATCRLSEIF
jgi:hypothetical protein